MEATFVKYGDPANQQAIRLMCGICGVAFTSPQRVVSPQTLDRMRDTLAYRGPDDAGSYIAPGVGLASRRLAILDLSESGRMPMSTPDGRFTITYNGEVYNYKLLRTEMEYFGYRFQSETDTEVVLALFARYGPGMLDHLNGMFAFAIWDEKERTIFLARDRLGVKPLCYVETPDALWFASEEKALFAAGIPCEFDHTTWDQLLCFRYVAGERTPYKNVKRLLPGHYLTWKQGECKTTRWWNLAARAIEIRENNPLHRLEDEFAATFDDSVDLRCIADVPVGVLLSGGLDSGSIAASMAMQRGDGIASFTVRFEDPKFDEGPLARQVTERWELSNFELYVPSNEVLDSIKTASRLNDQPLAHGNDFLLYEIAKMAKPTVTVLLSGEGADETMGGYVRYGPLCYPTALTIARQLSLGRLFQILGTGRSYKMGEFLKLESIDDIILFNACNVLPHQLRTLGIEPSDDFSYWRTVLQEARTYSPEPVRQAMYLDQHTFLCSLLDRNDRMTMGASIECRTPFLDYRLVELTAAMPTRKLFRRGRGKQILRRSVRERLPQNILNHKKWGFGVPWLRFLREEPEWRQMLMELSGMEPIVSIQIDTKAVHTLAKSFLSGNDRGYLLLLQLLMIAIWYQEDGRWRHPSESSS